MSRLRELELHGERPRGKGSNRRVVSTYRRGIILSHLRPPHTSGVRPVTRPRIRRPTNRAPFSSAAISLLSLLISCREIASGTLRGISNVNRRFATADVRRTIPRGRGIHIQKCNLVSHAHIRPTPGSYCVCMTLRLSKDSDREREREENTCTSSSITFISSCLPYEISAITSVHFKALYFRIYLLKGIWTCLSFVHKRRADEATMRIIQK